jgi:hypothetical protein
LSDYDEFSKIRIDNNRNHLRTGTGIHQTHLLGEAGNEKEVLL